MELAVECDPNGDFCVTCLTWTQFLYQRVDNHHQNPLALQRLLGLPENRGNEMEAG